jgi:hypothetical protein
MRESRRQRVDRIGAEADGGHNPERNRKPWLPAQEVEAVP